MFDRLLGEKNDLTTSEGKLLDTITLSYGLYQLNCGPTNILPNSSSCTDLIFINQNNFIKDRGVQASLRTNCLHEIVYAKLNLKTEYLPLYERLVWDYNKTNTQLLNRTTDTFSWEKLLENKNVNDQVYLFIKTMLNIFHNFIPNKNIICNEIDSSPLPPLPPPPWFNNQIKRLTERKNHLFKSYMAKGRLAMNRVRLQRAGAELINIIKYSKEKTSGKTLLAKRVGS